MARSLVRDTDALPITYTLWLDGRSRARICWMASPFFFRSLHDSLP